jgi:hypothetical protein
LAGTSTVSLEQLQRGFVSLAWEQAITIPTLVCSGKVLLRAVIDDLNVCCMDTLSQLRTYMHKRGVPGWELEATSS